MNTYLSRSQSSKTRIFKIIGLVAILLVVAFAVVRAVGHKKASQTVQPVDSTASPAANSGEAAGTAPAASPNLATPSASATSQEVSGTGKPEDAIILVYHSIEPATTKKETKMQKHYHILPENFEKQLVYLRDNGYTVISFPALVNAIKNGTGIPKKSVVLTFDDGWKNQYDYAFPLLKKYHMVGTFFIYPAVIGHGSFMAWKDVLDLDAQGMDVESHSFTHPMLPKITDAKILAHEIADSKKVLEEKLGHSISILAYPYYMYNQKVEDAVSAAGYAAARAGWVKTKNIPGTLFAMKSQEAVNNPNPFSAKAE